MRTVVVRAILLLYVAAAAYVPAHAATHQAHAPIESAAAHSPVVPYPRDYSPSWLEDRTFVYGPALLDFDLDAYFARSAPHLRPHAEFLSHWCGYYSISPKVLLTALELRDGAVSGDRAPGADFPRQAHEILSALYADFYAFRESGTEGEDPSLNAATYALLNLFRSAASVAEFAPAVEPARQRFLDTYTRLFPGPREAPALEPRTEAVPPADLLQLPWKIGESWYFNGVHTNTGSDPGVMSSIDMVRTWTLDWGDDTSTDYVVAAHAGQVTVFSSCNVRVTSPSGWATNYYHLSNLVVSSGQQVTANQTLGTYANTLAQATCQGGHSTGPHVHFSLLQNGVYTALDGAALSAYTVHAGRSSYDSDPAYMWLEKAGVRSFAYNSSITSTAPATPPSMTIDDAMVLEGNSGTRTARFTVSLATPVSWNVAVSYATTDGTASSSTVSTTVSNNTPVSIPASGSGTPYPTGITVSSGLGSITGLTVTLSDLSHSFLSDVDVLLVGPTGQSVMLMSDVASGSSVSGIDLTFADSGPSFGAGAPASGTYKPTNVADGEGDDLFAGPAPTEPYGSMLSAFHGTDPSGTWSLFVRDDCCSDGGSLAGWSLTVVTAAGGDYLPNAGTLTIPAGSSSQFLDVTVNGDPAVEPSETFLVHLSDPSGATLADGAGLGTIANDDFTDPSLPGVVVKAVHILELRTLINELRARRGLPAFSFTGTLTPDVTIIRALHITELRTALNAVYTAAGQTAPAYTNVLTPGASIIRAIDVAEIRTRAVNAP